MNKYQTKAEIDKKAKDQELADLLTLFHETRAEDLKIALAKQREEIIGMIEKKEKGFEAKDMEKYKISVNGCDATTEFEIELTASELETIKKVVELCNKTSSYGCEPKMEIELLTTPVEIKDKIQEKNDLLVIAYEELLELRGFLCDAGGKFNPDEEKLKHYWESPKSDWEKKLKTLGS